MYTIPTNAKDEICQLAIYIYICIYIYSNIQEVCVLRMGHFGKVTLAETVGLSAKDLW